MKADHTLAQLCAAFGVKRSGYHAWVQAAASKRERADAALLPKIRAVHQQQQEAREQHLMALLAARAVVVVEQR